MVCVILNLTAIHTIPYRVYRPTPNLPRRRDLLDSDVRLLGLSVSHGGGYFGWWVLYKRAEASINYSSYCPSPIYRAAENRLAQLDPSIMLD